MQNTLTVPQRRALIDLLSGRNSWEDSLRKSAKAAYETIRSTRRLEMVREASEKVKDLLDDLGRVRKEIKVLEEEESDTMVALNKRGFSVDSSGDITINSGSSIRKSIEHKLDGELGTLEDVIDLPIERAKVKIWTVATAEEADNLLEPFLNFEVKSK
jgi:hypothetical protein